MALTISAGKDLISDLVGFVIESCLGGAATDESERITVEGDASNRVGQVGNLT